MAKRSIDAGVVTGAILWAPVGSATIHVRKIVVSCSSSTTVTVYHGTDTTANRLLRGYFSANQGCIVEFNKEEPCARGDTIYVTNVNATASVTVYGLEF